jgi:hypothetical protein
LPTPFSKIQLTDPALLLLGEIVRAADRIRRIHTRQVKVALVAHDSRVNDDRRFWQRNSSSMTRFTLECRRRVARRRAGKPLAANRRFPCSTTQYHNAALTLLPDAQGWNPVSYTAPDYGVIFYFSFEHRFLKE